MSLVWLDKANQEAATFLITSRRKMLILHHSPPSAYWTLSETPQNCINEKMHLVISGSINTFTDFGVVLLPLPTVLSLKINRSQQAILVGLFGAGFAICLAGIFRIYFEFKSADTFDRTWVSFGLWISSVIELYVGVVSDDFNIDFPSRLIRVNHADISSKDFAKLIFYRIVQLKLLK